MSDRHPRRTVGAAVACLTALVAALAAPTPAHADGAASSSRLCGGTMQCSVQFDAPSRDGILQKVLVTGRPGARVELRTHLVRFTPDNKFDHLEPYGAPVEVRIGSGGTGSALLRNHGLGWPPPAVPGSPWLFVGPTDVDPRHFEAHVGVFVPFGTLSPQVLGDGWGDEKPVGEPIELHYTGAMPETEYLVEWKDDAGSWHDITTPTPGLSNYARSGLHPNAEYILTYVLPRGLPPKPHELRMRSVQSGLAIASWTATPSDHPRAKPILPLWTPPATLGGVSRDVGPRASRPAIVGSVGVALAASAGVIALVAGASLTNRPLRRGHRVGRGRA